MNFLRKIFCAVLLLAFIVSGSLNLPPTARAQSSFITDSVTKKLHDSPGQGRDFWFTICQNYDAGGGSGKVDVLYIFSQNATTIHVDCGVGNANGPKFDVPGYSIVSFKIPVAWEVTTSGVIENKAIRVHSDDEDLSVYLMSYNPNTSEGMLVLPSIGWGKSYVVAAYAGVFENNFDYASEFWD